MKFLSKCKFIEWFAGMSLAIELSHSIAACTLIVTLGPCITKFYLFWFLCGCCIYIGMVEFIKKSQSVRTTNGTTSWYGKKNRDILFGRTYDSYQRKFYSFRDNTKRKKSRKFSVLQEVVYTKYFQTAVYYTREKKTR